MNHTGQAEQRLSDLCGAKAFLVPSCTAALEIAFRLTIEPGDEVIIPSWAFPSCANAVILAGGTPVFVDVGPNNNITAIDVHQALSRKTKAVLFLHYGGFCGRELDEIIKLTKSRGIYVIEDAAQAIGSWKLSGDIGCMSFHYTKNIQCGQGGALFVKNGFIDRTERMVHCGTDKLKFYRGEQDYYSWLEVGSQQIMSEYQAEVLNAQLDRLSDITLARMNVWRVFKGSCPEKCQPFSNNGHFFWFLVENKWGLMRSMKTLGVRISSHFEALHNTVPGRKYGRAMNCRNSLMLEEKLLKLDTNITTEQAEISAKVLWQ